MYLHLGQSVAVPHREILGIFDLDNASWAYKTREFLGDGHSLHLSAVLRRTAAAGGEQFALNHAE